MHINTKQGIINISSINTIKMEANKAVLNLNHSIKIEDRTISNFIYLGLEEFKRIDLNYFIEVKGKDRHVYVSKENVVKICKDYVNQRICFYFVNLVSKPHINDVLVPEFMFIKVDNVNTVYDEVMKQLGI